MTEVTLVAPVGLGDLLLCSGAAVYALEKHKIDKLNFPCRAYHVETFHDIFKLYPKINVVNVTIGKEEKITKQLLDVDVLSAVGPMPVVPFDTTISFAENYYRNMDIPYSARWDYCPIEEACKPYFKEWHEGLPHEVFLFTHVDYDRQLQCDVNLLTKHLKKYIPGGETNLLKYAPYIAYADEGHYWDSCFRHLAESIKTYGSLFYHEYVRPYSCRRIEGEPDVPTRKKWITYEQTPFPYNRTRKWVQDYHIEQKATKLINEYGTIRESEWFKRMGERKADEKDLIEFLGKKEAMKVYDQNTNIEKEFISKEEAASIYNKNVVKEDKVDFSELKTHQEFMKYWDEHS